MPETSRRPLILFWCSTAEHTHDWFVVARTPREACAFHEGAEELERGISQAEAVATLPDFMQDRRYYGWPMEEVILACGGEIERDPTPQVVKVNGKRYVEGDLSHLLVQTLH